MRAVRSPGTVHRIRRHGIATPSAVAPPSGAQRARPNMGVEVRVRACIRFSGTPLPWTCHQALAGYTGDRPRQAHLVIHRPVKVAIDAHLPHRGGGFER